MTGQTNEKRYIGIDLGTSNSVVSFFNNGQFEQVEFRRKKIVPSAIYFESEDKVVFGEKALKKGISDPAHLLTAFKRDLGSDKKYVLKFDDNDEKDRIDTHYVIDTNIFIHSPDILESFSDRDKIHLSHAVQSELSFRAKQDETKVAAEISLENLEKMNDRDNIVFDESDRDLLPEDMTANSPNDDNDHRILSIALKLKQDIVDTPVVLITNDKGLQVKASSVGVEYSGLDEFRTKKNMNENEENTLTLTPKSASSYLLKYLKEESEQFIGGDIDKVVVTIPANFNQAQAELTKEAALDAGFGEVRIMKEPIAAGMAYALDREKDKKIIVYDFGGGTFDATLLQVGDGKLDVLGVDGDPHLGGEDITNILKEMIFEVLEDEYDLDMFEQEKSGLGEEAYRSNLAIISRAAEDAKIELSDFEQTTISIPNLNHPDNKTVNLEYELSRSHFEEEISEIRKKSLDVIKDLIANSGMEAKDIDMVVMAGGTSNIPSIYNSIKNTLGIDPYINKDTSIVISEGAVMEAIKLWDESNTVQEQVIYNDKALFDFGIGLAHYVFDPLILAGTKLPKRVEKVYSTERDDQRTLQIRAFQRKQGYEKSTRTHDKGIEYVDEIEIQNLPPSKVGDLRIKVTFELTKDDILAMSVYITDKEGNEVDAKDVKIKKVSEEY